MSSENDPLEIIQKRYIRYFDDHLEQMTQKCADGVPPRLIDAMFYSLRAGGKRLRPALCMAAADRCGLDPTRALPLAAAIEFIHTASLIHDDLPCMDDDDTRRGKPTNHKVYGEALAVIAGDSLMIWAFGYALSGLARLDVPAERALRAVAELSHGSGPFGMCGGQVLDTDPESQKDDREFVYSIASLKTAALIRSSVVGGALLAGAEGDVLDAWRSYGDHLGLAFQIIDDVLDVTSSKEMLGKTPHKDEAQNKRTFVSAYGLDEARSLAHEESEAAAKALLSIYPNGDILADVARSLAMRSR